MERVFEISFKTGVLFTVVSFILGQVLGVIGDGDLDLDLDGEISINTLIPLKPSLIAAFICVFGGVGMLLGQSDMAMGFRIAISVIAGYLVAQGLNFLIIRPLKRRQALVHSDESLIGHEAIVILRMDGMELGKIRYTVSNSTFTAPARANDLSRIEEGDQVQIKGFDRNVFLVSKEITE